jgi:hypothetical protein
MRFRLHFPAASRSRDTWSSLKAKLLVLPVAKDDETTSKKGIGATMLKLWNCSGLLSKAKEGESAGCQWKAAPL